MNQHQEPAYLLYKNPLAEADAIAHLLAAQGGHLQARIKGAKSLQRGFLYNPGDLLLIQYETSETTDFIRLTSHQPLVQRDWSRLGYRASLGWNLLLELVGRLAGKGLEPAALFALLQEAGTWNWEQEPTAKLVFAGCWQLLRHSGVAFSWQACQVCGRPSYRLEGAVPQFRKAQYRLQAGGLACGACVAPGLLDAAMIKVLWLAKSGQNLDAVPEALFRQWIRELISYLRQQFQVQVNSLPLWDQLRAEGDGSRDS